MTEASSGLPAGGGAPAPARHPGVTGTLFNHIPHPRIEERHASRPVKVNDFRPHQTAFARFNSWLGLRITLIVGTMVCAYAFMALALVSLPAALSSGSLIIIVAWIAQTFLQLVLLPIIIVGQNIQSAAADKRAEQTYNDAEAILHECLQLQAHLQAQDAVLTEALAQVRLLATPRPAGG